MTLLGRLFLSFISERIKGLSYTFHFYISTLVSYRFCGSLIDRAFSLLCKTTHDLMVCKFSYSSIESRNVCPDLALIAISGHAVSWHEVSCYAISVHTISGHAVSDHATSGCAFSVMQPLIKNFFLYNFSAKAFITQCCACTFNRLSCSSIHHMTGIGIHHKVLFMSIVVVQHPSHIVLMHPSHVV